MNAEITMSCKCPFSTPAQDKEAAEGRPAGPAAGGRGELERGRGEDGERAGRPAADEVLHGCGTGALQTGRTPALGVGARRRFQFSNFWNELNSLKRLNMEALVRVRFSKGAGAVKRCGLQ